MSSPDTALLVIDAQESFRQRPYWDDREVPAFFARLQALVNGAKAAGIPVVQCFHVEDTGAFSLAAGHVRTLAELTITPDFAFNKRRHSAFVGTELGVWLTERGIRRLIVSGIRTEQCCETTTRHASDLGYSVDYVTEATLTFPMVDYNGRGWRPAEIRERTELVLDGRFARIVTVKEALAPSRDAIAV
ncbi:MAG: isochorismatase family protein [Candidatus Eremiobacteraeota bacterium]|nr:isochorismatase family protein [Candidatus Eremiobacteraeota bacterium]MBV9408125.1 isochorismatase family protein [Candidatus Eremiobacteraeota bacterium]